jgi:hypothetical protein
MARWTLDSAARLRSQVAGDNWEAVTRGADAMRHLARLLVVLAYELPPAELEGDAADLAFNAMTDIADIAMHTAGDLHDLAFRVGQGMLD